MSHVPLEDFSTLSTLTELSSVALGGRVLAVSDEFFAEAFHLLLVEPPPSFKGQFGPKGALYSGWETRRHNHGNDWSIIKLGAPGTILGFDIDTTHFNGNEAPQAAVVALHASASEEPTEDDPRWSVVLPKVDLGPSSRHLFKIPESFCATHVKLLMFPDGGIARFRVYGCVQPLFPTNLSEPFDLAHVFSGGSVVFTSDQHFGVGSNLILPGRGKDMGDGWETKRSRQQGHKDWAIIKLGIPGLLEQAEIDTAHFMGNFPESCELHATLDANVNINSEWTSILTRTKLGADRRHFFQLQNVQDQAYTHVKVTIYPDGGIKRVRIIGRVAGTLSHGASTSISGSDNVAFIASQPSTTVQTTFIPVLPITPEAFKPFGQVIEAYADHSAAPGGTKITSANQGTATKFHKLALVESSYPPQVEATTGLSVYRCKAHEHADTWEVKVLERHLFTNQAFIPMGGDAIDDGDVLEKPGSRYLVVVAKSDADDRPDMSTLTAFVASGAQGIMYNQAVWHQPMTVLGRAVDFACVETQIGNGDKSDCEVIDLDPMHGVFKLRIPTSS